MYKEWILKKLDASASMSIVEKLLATRGITKQDEVKEFLNPLEIKLTQPSVFTNLQPALLRIADAIDNGENILIYGDFDADGVTSTALLLRTFKFLEAKVDYFIPDRELHGHGLNSKALVKILATKKPKLIITCDCASSDVEQVSFLNSFKVDVIITDHHETPEQLPAALAIINPKAPNALDESLTAGQIQNLTSLAGVGVAFKLAQGILNYYNKLDFIYEILPYVAVGTIADIVPLVGENRYFVAKGLQLISSGKHYGLKRLLENAGYSLDNGITSEQIAFGVAPRINASGRLDTIEDALKVLVSDNKQEIEMSIISLNNFNKVRQELCENIFLEADEMLNKEGNNSNSIILFNPKWHLGIIGIVASKLVEKYYKPVFLMTYSEETKQIRCSARSIEEVNIYDVLSANAELFDGYGGHSMAGGLSFDKDRIAFEEVKKAISKTVDEILSGQNLQPRLYLDLSLQPSEVDGNLISDIERLQPFGAANPSPIFAMYNLTLVQKKLMGSNKNHLKLVVEDSNHNLFDCIWWSKGDISLQPFDVLDIAFSPQVNTFNGNTSIQLILQDVHADNLVEESSLGNTSASDVKIYDHRKKTNIFSSVEDYVKSSNLKFVVFAEDKDIIQALKPYKTLHSLIKNRDNVETVDSLMFFDYPPSPEIFDAVVQKASAKHIHFMNYEQKLFDEKDLLKTFFGMLKFSINNKNGVFDINRSAAFLALTCEAIKELLVVFEQSGIISVSEKGEAEFKISTILSEDLSKVLHCSYYKEFLSLLNEVVDYRQSIMDTELGNISY